MNVDKITIILSPKMTDVLVEHSPLISAQDKVSYNTAEQGHPKVSSKMQPNTSIFEMNYEWQWVANDEP